MEAPGVPPTTAPATAAPTGATGPAPASDVTDELVAELMNLFRPRGPRQNIVAHGLTMAQLQLLFRIRREGPMTMGSIARCTESSLQATTAIIGRVERQGLVLRVRPGRDRRIVEVHLTDDGTQALDELAGHRMQHLRELIGRLTPGERDDLLRLVRAMATREPA
jgi:DNA-binding MarR family transcriptional regulator